MGEDAERGTYKAAARTNGLAIRKAVELAEARCQNRPFNKKELSGIEEMENRFVDIETFEEWEERVFAEEAEAARQAEEDAAELEKEKAAKKAAADKKAALAQEAAQAEIAALNGDNKEEEDPEKEG